MNECTVCKGAGLVKTEVEINGTKSIATVLCGECGGSGEFEDICK